MSALAAAPPPGGRSGTAKLDQADAAGTLRLHSDDGAVAPLVVIASERISDEPWAPLRDELTEPLARPKRVSGH